jgi:hypothetical protein
MPNYDEEHHYGIGNPMLAPVANPEPTAEGPSEAVLTKQYGKGFSMLKKMGFKTGTGLGPTGEGITTPIEVSMRRKKEGLTEEELIEPPGVELKPVVPPQAAKLTALDIERIELSREIENLTDKKRRIEYDIFSLSSQATDVPSSFEVDDLIRDLITSQILTGNVSWEIFAQYVAVLRDKYDCSSLWYELEVESVITAAVASMVRKNTLDKSLEIIREILIDDEDFVRILEFDILSNLIENDMIVSLEDLLVLKSITTVGHYESIFFRFSLPYLEELIKSNMSDALETLIEWMPVIPQGTIQAQCLDRFVKPILVFSPNPSEVLRWREFFSSFEWQNEIVVRITGRILDSLRRIKPSDEDAFDLVHVAISWSKVVPPLVIGYLLTESGFLPGWCEYWRNSPGYKNTCRKWFPTLAKVCYRTPSRRVLVDGLKILNGGPAVSRRPAPPPRGVFRGSLKSYEGLSEAAVGKLTFGDVVKEECEARNIPLVPKPGIREAGVQVYKVGDRTVYWKDDALFEKKGEWVEISLDSLFR